METYNLDLEFIDDQKSELPHRPIAHVCVKTYGRAVTDGPPQITPGCVTIREIEYQIDRLKSELENILTKARAKFAVDYKRQCARASARI